MSTIFTQSLMINYKWKGGVDRNIRTWDPDPPVPHYCPELGIRACPTFPPPMTKFQKEIVQMHSRERELETSQPLASFGLIAKRLVLSLSLSLSLNYRTDTDHCISSTSHFSLSYPYPLVSITLSVPSTWYSSALLYHLSPRHIAVQLFFPYFK